jgi:hypothetical protein
MLNKYLKLKAENFSDIGNMVELWHIGRYMVDIRPIIEKAVPADTGFGGKG